MLLKFIHAYMNDEGGVRTNFEKGNAAERAQILAAFGVTDDEATSAVLREDEHAMGGLITRALIGYADARRNKVPQPPVPFPLWPGVPLHVDGVTLVGPGAAAVGVKVKLLVKGWFFEADPAVLRVTFADGVHTPVLATLDQCLSVGTYGRTEATVHATFTHAGTYSVIVSNRAGGRAGSSTLPKALTVV